MPKSPSGKLVITKHRLKKTPVSEPTKRKLRCTVCCKAFEDKDTLKLHHQAAHSNINCEACNKVFATKRSLRKHSYTHLEKQITCGDYGQKFSFNSKLEIHKIKHSTEPTFRCKVFGCNKEYYRKSELTAHIVNHVGQLIQCLEPGCVYGHMDTRYVKQHRRRHTNDLQYGCRYCDKCYKYFKQRKRHEGDEH